MCADHGPWFEATGVEATSRWQPPEARSTVDSESEVGGGVGGGAGEGESRRVPRVEHIWQIDIEIWLTHLTTGFILADQMISLF